MSVSKDAIMAAFAVCSCRLVEPMFLCEVHASQDVLGKVFDVLMRRRAIILKEEYKEGSNIFVIRSHLPVVQSFGFADELRKKTSGAAVPQLAFSHWQVLEVDPFWVATTDEEREEEGEGAGGIKNVALELVMAARKRKGMSTLEQAVDKAEKQRTLARKR